MLPNLLKYKVPCGMCRCARSGIGSRSEALRIDLIGKISKLTALVSASGLHIRRYLRTCRARQRAGSIEAFGAHQAQLYVEVSTLWVDMQAAPPCGIDRLSPSRRRLVARLRR